MPCSMSALTPLALKAVFALFTIGQEGQADQFAAAQGFLCGDQVVRFSRSSGSMMFTRAIGTFRIRKPLNESGRDTIGPGGCQDGALPLPGLIFNLN